MKVLFRKLGVNQNHKSMGKKLNVSRSMGQKLNLHLHHKEHHHFNEDEKHVKSDLEKSHDKRTSYVRDGHSSFIHR
jgi:hypothetical protein